MNIFFISFFYCLTMKAKMNCVSLAINQLITNLLPITMLSPYTTIITYKKHIYSLDDIIHVGARVKSHQGTQFRIWGCSAPHSSTENVLNFIFAERERGCDLFS